jgi:hypothetical protein
VLLIGAAEVRVDRAADGLGNTRRPVRQKGLALLVGKRGLGTNLSVKAYRTGSPLTTDASAPLIAAAGDEERERHSVLLCGLYYHRVEEGMFNFIRPKKMEVFVDFGVLRVLSFVLGFSTSASAAAC